MDSNITSSDVSEERTSLLERLERSERRRAELVAIKKSMTKDYGDQIKELDAEIKGILANLEN